ncbi:oligosaccharide flippase family protein [Microbacterium sp. KUDC0406]|uniref:oligosaccharide flippase family protein n=1 Tax=Microbacterium sp. KUDC0406 TaxID=2909588 RepID=UPI003FA525A1
MLAVELVALVRAAAEAAIISHGLGLTAYGYLTVAQRLVQAVQELTGSALAPVTTVAFAKWRADSERLTRSYVRALGVIYAMMTPTLLLLAVAAPLIVPIVFGPGWEQSFFPTQILALAGIAVMGASLDLGLFYGVGKPGVWLIYAVIVDAATVGTTLVMVPHGLPAVVLGFLGVAVGATMVRQFLVARLLGVRVRETLRPIPMLLTSVIVVGAAGLGTMALLEPFTPLLCIVFVGIVMIGMQVLVLRVTARSVLNDIRSQVTRLLRRHAKA